MQNLKSIITSMLLLFAILSISAQEVEAPYFLLKDAQSQHMILESSKAEVFISGIIADVRISQEYRNTGNDVIEAMYVFPGSSQSAVYDMEMQIGNRIIKAELKEKEEARKTYEQAKAEGKRTSLLEQHRPNVFQMNVANIMPGEKIIVRLKYTEQIIPSFGKYSFDLPTVVGPRYHEPEPNNPAQFVNMPYTHEKESPLYEFDLQIILNGGKELKNIVSHTHQLNIERLSDQSVYIRLSPEEIFGGNRDFVLNYYLAEDHVSSGLLLYEHNDEKFFLANIQAPQMITEEQIPAREYIFIIDVSGSMFGFPLDLSKKMMKELLSGLRPIDRFNMLLFAGTSFTYSDTSVYASAENIDHALNGLGEFNGGGSTRLLPALDKAIHLPRMTDQLSRSLVVLTDGYISVEKEAFELIRHNLNRANVFAFGIGSGINRFLIEGLANVGQGKAFIVENETVACDISEAFNNYISTPSLTDISLEYYGFNAYDIADPTVPDLFADRPLNIIGKWRGNAHGQIILKATFAGQPFTQVLEVQKDMVSKDNQAIRYLWARKKLQLLDDYRKVLYDDGHKDEMLGLSLKYGLLSAYTSFVAVDYEQAHDGQLTAKPVKQALPLPAGVSDYAIGAEMEVKSKKIARKESFNLKLASIEGDYQITLHQKIKKMAVLNIYRLKKCLGNAGKMKFIITLDFKDGELNNVLLSGVENSALEKSILEEVKQWDFTLLELSNENFRLTFENQ